MANANTIYVAKRAAAGGGTAWATTETVIRDASDSTKACVVYLPGSNKLNGKKFRIRATGRVTGGTTVNFTIAMYKGSSTTVASNTKIATSAATAVNSANGSWDLNYEATWDTTSDIVQAVMYGHNNGTAIARAAATANMTSLDPATEGTAISLTGLFSASNAGNAVTVDEFIVEIM